MTRFEGFFRTFGVGSAHGVGIGCDSLWSWISAAAGLHELLGVPDRRSLSWGALLGIGVPSHTLGSASLGSLSPGARTGVVLGRLKLWRRRREPRDYCGRGVGSGNGWEAAKMILAHFLVVHVAVGKPVRCNDWYRDRDSAVSSGVPQFLLIELYDERWWRHGGGGREGGMRLRLISGEGGSRGFQPG